MGDKISVITRYNVPTGESSYESLKELMNEQPDILFATSPGMAAGALRLSLENPDKTILHCDFAQPKRNIMTYYAKFHEAAFLCGVMAGSMTKTGRIGYTTAMANQFGSVSNLNAFTIGARLVNPGVSVININLHRPDAPDHYHASARKTLAQKNVDIAMCIHQQNTPLVRKGFPGVYAQVYLLNRDSGHPDECIGAAAVDWSVLYNELVGDNFNSKNSILDITRSGMDSSVHFGWGLNTGILDVLGVDAFMGHNAMRLLNIFKDLIVSGKIHPFEGPLFDQDRNMILEKYATLNMLEIQNATWIHEGVVESIDLF